MLVYFITSMKVIIANNKSNKAIRKNKKIRIICEIRVK